MGTKSISAEARWRQISQEQVDSGQTVAQFCRSRGIAESSLFAWKRRLRHSPGAPGSAFVEAKLQGRDDAVERADGIWRDERGGECWNTP
jgi:transposase-like protein